MPPRQLQVSLNGIEPPIWRRFWVEETITLGRLHEVLQIVMGWQDYHLHQFITGERFEDQVFFMPPWDDGFGDPEFMARQRDETRVKSGVPWSGVTREDQPRLRRG
ncbi:plasmid pRiA4b ORF-3 family protein [Cyanobium sp. ATX 6A2]|nr:plasmid pRiA4b ORF-3 family protein [Cyanobium sp. ATX 6A2]